MKKTSSSQEKGTRKRRAKSPADEGRPHREHPAVLIVDDAPQVLRLVTDLFKESLPNVTVYTATDTQQGTTKLFEIRPDLLITDVAMPGPAGTELIGLAKTEGRLRGTKVLAITGQDTPEIRRSALGSGADAFLTKPFEGRAFIKAVRALLPGIEPDEFLDEEEEDPGVEELGDGPQALSVKSEDEEPTAEY